MIDLAISTAELEYFLLVFIRMVSFMNMAPFYGEVNVPVRFKVALAMFLSYIVYVSAEPSLPVYNTILEYSLLIMKELAVGLLIGLAASICMHVTAMAGRLIDMEIGLSAANMTDPTFHDSITISGMMLRYFFMLLLITSGMYQYIIKAVIETYTLIPVAGVRFEMGNLMTAMIDFLGQYFILGFRISMPIFAVILVINCVLGILAKVAPQMHLFSVGMQIKILTGLGILYISMWLIPKAADLLFTRMRIMIVSIVEALM